MSGNPNWITPDWFFLRVCRAWGPFGLDAAASAENTKAPSFISEGMDALKTQWRPWGMWKSGHNVWLNPPYVNLMAWVTKAAEESDKGLTIVMLLPWGQWAEWMEVAAKRAELVRVVGRIKFIDPAPPGEKPRTSPNGMNILAVFRPPIEGVTWPVGFVGAKIDGVKPE